MSNPLPHGYEIPQHLKRAKWLSRLLDSSIKLPFIRKKIGLDPLLSAIPVWGDAIGLALGLYIVWVGLQLALPGHVILRMMLNILIDFGIGAVPVAGDILDAFWKSNQKNVILLEEAYHALKMSSGGHASTTGHSHTNAYSTTGPVIEVKAEPAR